MLGAFKHCLLSVPQVLIFSSSKRMLKIMEQMVLTSGYNYRCHHCCLVSIPGLHWCCCTPALTQPSCIHLHWLSPAALKSLQTVWRVKFTG